MPAFQPDPTGAVTHRIAAFARETQWRDIPDKIRREAKRSILNGFATALGGAREPAIDKSLAVLAHFSGSKHCSIIGRPERADMLLCTYINAMAANIADFDDTHPATIIHPTAPVAPALFAYVETTPTTGEALLRAFIIGAEVECRLGNALSPCHYAHGWHITSTCGVFGSAIAIGTLLDLTEDQFTRAISNATAQAAGMVETLGTMSKSISVGNAARNGIKAALLATHDFSSPAASLEGTQGFLSVYTDEPNSSALTDDLGAVWEIGTNTYKPYPVGVVLNPVLEACLDLRAKGTITLEDVADVELTGHPLLQQRADRLDVITGRESQVSAQHAIAIALRRGRAGLAETTNIRPNLTFIDDGTCDIESACVRITTRAGDTHIVKIKNTRGGTNNPLTDVDLDDKLKALAEYGGLTRDVTPLANALWALDNVQDAGVIMKHCVPS
jgi:2-methylcitrate dehydratase PrpD